LRIFKPQPPIFSGLLQGKWSLTKMAAISKFEGSFVPNKAHNPTDNSPP